MKIKNIFTISILLLVGGNNLLYSGVEGDGQSNTYYGTGAGNSLNGNGFNNVFIGVNAGGATTEGDYNTFVGAYIGTSNTEGISNTLIGYGSGQDNTTGSCNTFIGTNSGHNNKTGLYNSFLGFDSGFNADVNNSVFIGNHSGYNATRDNTLYISNSNTDTPLIYGEFDTEVVKINGELNTTKTITASFSGSSTKQALKMINISVNNSNSAKRSDVGFAMTNARENFTWSFRTWEDDKGFAISKYGNGATKEFRLYDTNPTNANSVILRLANGAYCDGTWHNTSSRTMKQDIKPLKEQEALEAFKKLKPVVYTYKTNPTDKCYGYGCPFN